MSLPVAILAGGLATRLRPITAQIPKVLVDVNGEPFAVHQLRLLRRQGLTDAVFCIGHLGEQVEAALGDGAAWGLRVRYSPDGGVLLGTGGALRQARPLLGEAFFVLYGDSYLECDFAAVEAAFHAGGRLGLMTVFRNEGQWDTSNVQYEAGEIRRYDKHERTPAMRHIDYGLGVLRAEALAGYPAGQPLDLAVVYQDLLARGQLAAYEVAERFYEIGSPAGLAETRRYLEQKREPR
ncbi:MAG: nucleotidyltransferase family protein [Anaerolineales bacterium]|nr:nucleotidyltransferase family protein [Anaerolineales bacterium]